MSRLGRAFWKCGYFIPPGHRARAIVQLSWLVLATIKAWMAGTSPAMTSRGYAWRRYPALFFLPNNALMLSSSSIFAPCLRMMTLCCSTESELFQAQ
jgi:hypothetical protein